MFARLAQGSLKSHFAQRALLLSFFNHSRTDSWSFSIVEGLLLHHEMPQSVTLLNTHQLQHGMGSHIAVAALGAHRARRARTMQPLFWPPFPQISWE